MITLTLAWWWVPAALVAAGVIVGCWRASKYPHDDGLCDARTMVFVFWFLLFCALAVGAVGGRVLLS